MFTRNIGLIWQFQTPKTGWLCLKQARNHKSPIKWSQTMPVWGWPAHKALSEPLLVCHPHKAPCAII